MAHIEMTSSPDVKDWLEASQFWNVSSNVGYGYQNKKADVLLVQYFLNVQSYSVHTKTYEDTPLVTDGVFGGKTWSRIKKFQRTRAGGGGAVADGMVSTTNGDRLYSPKQSLIYTIYWLNWAYICNYPAYFRDIRMDPGCPVELTNILSGPMPDLG